MCPDPACRGHEQGLIDWEFTAFQRRLGPDRDQPVAAIRKRWFADMCRPSNDVYFYVGNQAKRHQVFSILGVVYPRK